MLDKVTEYFKAIFFQGWFWVDKAEESQTELTLIIVLIIVVVVAFFLLKIGFFRKSK